MAVKTYQKTDRIQISTNFNSREFRCGLGRPCSCPTTLIDDLLVVYLQKIRDYFGAPVTITSAYRCPSYNSSVGGATGSYHTRGQAADIVVQGVAPRRVAAYAESIGVLGIGLYETAADGYFVHIDTRAYKSYWYGQSQSPRSTFGGAAAAGPGASGSTGSTGSSEAGESYSLEQFIRDVQAACGAAVDGIVGPETLGKTGLFLQVKIFPTRPSCRSSAAFWPWGIPRSEKLTAWPARNLQRPSRHTRWPMDAP